MTISAGSNKFCSLKDLGNEATVEQFFINRLLTDLGYSDAQIRPKSTLRQLLVNAGRKAALYRPDYALSINRRIRWVVEAKAVDENLDDWVGQCAGYCLALNREQATNPTEYFLLSNANETRLYRWDSNSPVLTLGFDRFVDSDPGYKQLRSLLGPDALAKSEPAPEGDVATHTLYRRSISELNGDFAYCHRLIYRRENVDYSKAFMEFVKIIFLKLLSDREVHSAHPEFPKDSSEITIPSSEVRFARTWIAEREPDHPNPLDALQFQKLLQDFEGEIVAGRKKRIFQQGERLDLQPETIKALVERLESSDLYSIDADLNGRLFETFLNATLRGKDLGQYFTPRSVVKLATRLANIVVTPDHIDRVLDACCGTGGFLIEALADMWQKVDGNASLSGAQRTELRRAVAEDKIFGVDVARDPGLARIARINMYLRGDGGSRIYQADILDKSLVGGTGDSPEIKNELRELRRLIEGTGFADVVLTNPPFAKEYNRDQSSESRLLDEYDLAFENTGGSKKPRKSLRSSAMFIERYHDLLRPGGRMVTVLDDSILGAESYAYLRDWIRKHYLVRAVVSLPGDAFQRSQARVKTSVLVLEKKRSATDTQPSVFMYYCTDVGVDDPPRQRVLPIDEVNREKARHEIDHVSALFRAFLSGQPEAEAYIVPPEAILDRLDVKACLLEPGRNVPTWAAAGLEVVELGTLVDRVFSKNATMPGREADKIDTSTDDDLVVHLRVRYDGFAEPGDEIYASDSKYRSLYRVHADDLVISHINAVHGAIAVVPPELDGLVVTSEYTVCRSRGVIDPRVLWLILRSPNIRSEFLLLSTGIGRSRVNWTEIRRLRLPLPTSAERERFLGEVASAEQLESQARLSRRATTQDVQDSLTLASEDAEQVLQAFKPPR